MRITTSKLTAIIFIAFLLSLVSACRSTRTEPPVPTATSQGSVDALDVVTVTPEPTESTDSGASANNAAAVTQADDETPIPPTSTPVSITAASMASRGDKEGNEAAEDAPVEASLSDAASGKSAQQVEPNQESLGGIMPHRIQIPSIDLDTPVVELSWHAAQSDDGQIFSEWDVADQAAGWHKNSSLIGENGNVVLSGHNNILGAVFRELDQLKRGDEALLSTEEGVHRYLIDKVMIVPEKYATLEQREANAAWIGHFEDDRLTLVSCWPRDDNSHRIIVVAYSEQSLP